MICPISVPMARHPSNCSKSFFRTAEARIKQQLVTLSTISIVRNFRDPCTAKRHNFPLCLALCRPMAKTHAFEPGIITSQTHVMVVPHCLQTRLSSKNIKQMNAQRYLRRNLKIGTGHPAARFQKINGYVRSKGRPSQLTISQYTTNCVLGYVRKSKLFGVNIKVCENLPPKSLCGAPASVFKMDC